MKEFSYIDDLFAAIYLAGIENGIGRQLADTEEIMHRKEAFIKNNPLHSDAKEGFKAAMLELLENNLSHEDARSISVAKLRAALETLVNSKGT